MTGMTAFLKGNGPAAALFFGSLAPKINENRIELIMTSYGPRLFDLAKLNELSPIWLRLAPNISLPESRSASCVNGYSELFKKFTSYYARMSFEELGLKTQGSLVFKRVQDMSCPSQIAMVCAARFDSATVEISKPGEALSSVAANIASEIWVKHFFGAMFKSFAAKRGVVKAWDVAPEGSCAKALRFAFFDEQPSSPDGSGWAKQLLAIEQAAIIAKTASKPKIIKSKAGAPKKRL